MPYRNARLLISMSIYGRNFCTRKALTRASADPEGGGTGGPDPPLENHKLYGFL